MTSGRRASRLLLVLGAGVMLGLAGGLLSWLDPEFGAEPEPTPRPTLVAVGGDISVLPEAPPGFVEALRSELSTALRDAYAHAFLPQPETDPSTSTPTPTPGPRLTDFFTAPAAEAMRSGGNVFRSPRDVEIHIGRVRFSGIATQQDGVPLEAYLEVRLRADGRSVAEDEEPREVRLGQSGRLLMVKGEAGWRIAGFDLVLNDRREVRDDDLAMARGRWFP